jgi:hypothetical protein
MICTNLFPSLASLIYIVLDQLEGASWTWTTIEAEFAPNPHYLRTSFQIHAYTRRSLDKSDTRNMSAHGFARLHTISNKIVY